MSLYDQINDEVILMDAGEQKWIGQDLALESMVAVELLLQDLQEDKVIKIRRKNHEKSTGLKQIDRILIEKL
jgi:ribosomal protein L21